MPNLDSLISFHAVCKSAFIKDLSLEAAIYEDYCYRSGARKRRNLLVPEVTVGAYP